jgi:4-hydroxy-2-oxoheptanedioate aldolase
VPHVNTREEAEAAVAACKYFPEGQRGIFSGGRPAEYGIGGTTQEYVAKANANTLVCLMLEEVEAIDNISEIVTVKGVDVLFIGSGDLSTSMGYPGQQAHPEVQAVMEKGVKRIREAGIVAGVSCPDSLVPKFLGLGVRYFHGSVGRFLQSGGDAYLKAMRKSA